MEAPRHCHYRIGLPDGSQRELTVVIDALPQARQLTVCAVRRDIN